MDGLLPEALAVLLGALVGWGIQIGAAFSKTHLGANPWDLDSFKNALRVSPHVYKAIGMLNGEMDSMFRSPNVNAQLLVVGAASNSYHQHGLAVDIKPGTPWKDVESAFRYIVANVKLGTLGPVRTVIWEPTWVHLDWFKENETVRPPNFFKKVTAADGKITYSPVQGL